MSSPYTVSKTGNSFVSSQVPGSPQNFGLGTSAAFDFIRSKGSYTNVALNTIHNYSSLSDVSTDVEYTPGTGILGTGAMWNVERDSSGSGYTVTVAAAGSDYSVTDEFVIRGSAVGGSDGAHNILIVVTAITGTGGIDTFTANGTQSNINTNAGTGYSVGEKIVVYGNSLGGSAPFNDLDLYITGVGGNGDITAFSYYGVGIASTQSYLSLEQDLTSGSGINSAFTVVRTGDGEVTTQVDKIEIGGIIEVDDIFNVTIDGTTTHSYTALALDDRLEVRNGLIAAINTTVGTCFATAGNTIGEGASALYTIDLFATTPGVGFTTSVQSEDAGANPADDQTITVSTITANNTTTTTPAYTVTVTNPGTGYANNDTITIHGNKVGGDYSTNAVSYTHLTLPTSDLV